MTARNFNLSRAVSAATLLVAATTPKTGNVFVIQKPDAIGELYDTALDASSVYTRSVPPAKFGPIQNARRKRRKAGKK